MPPDAYNLLRPDTRKAIQAAAVLIELDGGMMSSFRLLKLLYIADRESLKETGRPITFAHPWALRNGPVPGEIYDLVKGSHKDVAAWEKYIHAHGYKVRLIADPGRGALSRYEIEKLRTVSKSLETYDDCQLAELTGEFQEFRNNKPEKESSNPIPLSALIEAVGLDKEQVLQGLKDKCVLDDFYTDAAAPV